ncbi:nucleoside-diphosphate kinase [Candidatus Saccharibacteria bacterium]|nr:nucleoside-diphosphate kinase [Candidatus Saccharibacteria bacterium]
MTSTECTLVILKPDALERGLVGEIIQRFERVGLEIVGIREVLPDKELCRAHYEGIGGLATRLGEKVYRQVEKYLTRGPVIPIIFEGVDAVSEVRKMIGPTEPKSALPGTIRGDYAHMSYEYANANNIAIENLVHASGSSEEAEQEIKLWFGDVLGTEPAL